jgi:malonyl CoA-acyl carrier protein transacylase
MTRPRRHLVVVGDSETVSKGSEYLKSWIDFALRTSEESDVRASSAGGLCRPPGDVPPRCFGPLRELRRLNVSMTRPRRHLVVVGDSETVSKGSEYLRTSEESDVRASSAGGLCRPPGDVPPRCFGPD